MDAANNSTRPALLDEVSETQMQEMEQQFNEQDESGWQQLTESYGWTPEESQAVWDWFGVQPEGSQ